jgi:hypothetical protein
MSTVFVGGSRNVSRLPPQVQERLSNVLHVGAKVIIGDANGADKAVQKFLSLREYRCVTVFCSGEECGNNVGHWETRYIDTPKGAKGFDFYAAKDRAMAREADYGLMIWDGKSAGTILNILRLLRAGRKAVLIDVPKESATNFKTLTDWSNFISICSPEFREDIRKRAAPSEWVSTNRMQQIDLLGLNEETSAHAYHADSHSIPQHSSKLPRRR